MSFSIFSLYVLLKDFLGFTLSSKIVSSSLWSTVSIKTSSSSLSLSVISNNSSKFIKD
jgi:hypothetical protein